MCVPAPGHEHDVTVGLPGLAADPSVLATVVVATYTPGRPTVPEALPEGFDARLTFDPARARARLWPAIDPSRTSPRAYPDSRHERISCAAHDTLASYAVIDPVFALPPVHVDDPAGAEKAQALVRSWPTRSARSNCSPHCRRPTPRWPRSSTSSRPDSTSDLRQRAGTASSPSSKPERLRSSWTSIPPLTGTPSHAGRSGSSRASSYMGSSRSWNGPTWWFGSTYQTASPSSASSSDISA